MTTRELVEELRRRTNTSPSEELRLYRDGSMDRVWNFDEQGKVGKMSPESLDAPPSLAQQLDGRPIGSGGQKVKLSLAQRARCVEAQSKTDMMLLPKAESMEQLVVALAERVDEHERLLKTPEYYRAMSATEIVRNLADEALQKRLDALLAAAKHCYFDVTASSVSRRIALRKAIEEEENIREGNHWRSVDD